MGGFAAYLSGPAKLAEPACRAATYSPATTCIDSLCPRTTVLPIAAGRFRARFSSVSRLLATHCNFAAPFLAVTWVRFSRKSFPSKQLRRGFPPMIRRPSSDVCGSGSPMKKALRALSRSIRRIRLPQCDVISITGGTGSKSLCDIMYTSIHSSPGPPSSPSSSPIVHPLSTICVARGGHLQGSS